MTPELTAALDRRDTLDLCHQAHQALLDESPTVARQCASLARNSNPSGYVEIARGWDRGEPKPGTDEWPLWYSTERADVTETIRSLEAANRV